jgi:high-affinity iron transporter
MNFSAAIPTFVITLREGVEAALVVGIVLACLKKAGQNRLSSWVYAGVGAGIVVSAIVGILFSLTIPIISAANPKYTTVVEPLLEGIFSVIAIAMLSWMLVWMTRQARFMKAQVEGTISAALQDKNAGWGVFTLILVAVLREGFETVLFIAANFQQGLVPAFGAIAGVLTAAVLGVLLFRWGVKINIRLFFKTMGVLLLLIVAGLVVGALENFDIAFANLAQMDRSSQGLCFYYERFTKHPSCILGARVWDTSKILPDDKFPGLVFKALFGYRENLFIVQAVAYVIFLLTIGSVYFRSLGGKVNKKIESSPQLPLRTKHD